MPILNFTEEGNGPPLIIIHGLFGSLSNWKNISKKFIGNYRVILPDLRNHGVSFHSDTMNYEVMSDDILTLMQHLSIKSANIIGHSMGGKVAMLQALKYPDSILKLIVADIAPVTYTDGHLDIINSLLSLDIKNIKRRIDADIQLSESISDPRVRQFLLQNLQRTPSGYHWRINLTSLKNNIKDIMSFPKQHCPDRNSIQSLFIAGEHSNYLDKSSTTKAMDCFPEADFKVIAETGHWLHAEKPVAFSKLVEDFLKK